MSKMTRKDYEMIAKAVRLAIDYNRQASQRMSASEEYRLAHVDYMVEDGVIATNLATLFQADNPKFDRERFLVACGIDNHIHNYVIQPDDTTACNSCGETYVRKEDSDD